MLMMMGDGRWGVGKGGRLIKDGRAGGAAVTLCDGGEDGYVGEEVAIIISQHRAERKRREREKVRKGGRKVGCFV